MFTSSIQDQQSRVIHSTKINKNILMKSLSKAGIVILGFFMSISVGYSQNSVGIGTPNSNENAVLELVSPGGNQGFLVPRLSTAERTSMTANLTNAENGLLVYDNEENIFYYWNNSQWMAIDSDAGLLAGDGISISGNTISNTGDGDTDPSNEIQDLNLDGTTLTVTNNSNATAIDLSPFSGTNTDEQDLSNTRTANDITLNITNGAGTTFNVDDGDADPVNEIQDLQLVGNSLSITDNPTATTIDLAPFMGTNTDEQDLMFSGGIISLSGDPDATSIDLSNYDMDVTDDFDGDFGSLSGVPGDLADGDDVDDADNFVGNEFNANFQINGGNLEITDGGGTLSVPVISLQDGTGTDDQQLTFDIPTQTLTLEDGGAPVDLSSLLDNTDQQDLMFAGGIISLSGDPDATNIDLSNYDMDVTDDFQLPDQTGNGGNFLTTDGINPSWAALADNDANNELITSATLEAGDILRITEAGTDHDVDLSSLAGSGLWSQNGSDVFYNTGSVGIGISAPTQLLHIQATGNPRIEVEGTGSFGGGINFRSSSSNWTAYNQSDEFRISREGVDLMALEPNGEFGIGTFNPSAKLEVVSNGITNATFAQLIFDGGGSNLLSVRDDGNVGIGILNPNAKLDVQGNALINGNLNFSNQLNTIQFPATGGANNPMINMFASGSNNADRMVIAHSPGFPTWGLQYQDGGDSFSFLRGGTSIMDVNLGSQSVSVNAPLQANGTFATPSDGSVIDVNTTSFVIPTPTTRIIKVRTGNGGEVTGIEAGVEGQELMIVCVSATEQNAPDIVDFIKTISTTASDKIFMPNDISIDRWDTLHFIYDADLDGWLLVSSSSNTIEIN